MAGSGYAVVGGGIVGASVAYHLGRRTSDPVTVYERGELASETTHKSTSMIGVSGPEPYRRMQAYGFRLYNEFFADPRASPEYRQSGRLRVATTADGRRDLERLASDDPERSARGGSVDPDATRFANSLVRYLPGDEIRGRLLVPLLDTDPVEGALHRPEYGYVGSETRTLGPRDLALEFVDRARDAGVTFETNAEVADVLTDGDRVTGIETADGTTNRVESVVCAAGPWTGQLLDRFGLDSPLGRRPSPVFRLELDRPVPCSMPAIKSHESSVGIHPKRDDVVLVTYSPDGAESTDPDAVGDAPLETHRRTAMRWAERLLPSLVDADLTDEWVGVGTTTPDGYPVAGWTDVAGLSVAASPSGIQFAPSVGSIIARQLVENDPTEYYDAVSITRFDGYDDSRPGSRTD